MKTPPNKRWPALAGTFLIALVVWLLIRQHVRPPQFLKSPDPQTLLRPPLQTRTSP